MDNRIGDTIKNVVSEQGRSIKWLAEQLNCDRTNVYNIFKRDNIDLLLLKKLSVILTYNFFTDICDDTAGDIAAAIENKS